MVGQLPQHSHMIAGNRHLPEKRRQNMILLSFAEPIPHSRRDEFKRIHLTREMFAGGEDDFYDVGIAQPHRGGSQLCGMCRQPMLQVSPTGYRCRNLRCSGTDGTPSFLRTQYAGPLRGVVATMAPPDFVSHREPIVWPNGQITERIWLNRLILVLDRRYREVVLASIYRTAGELCDLLGWKLKT